MSDEVTPVRVKVCGVTTTADAIMCAQAGVQMIGLNFARESRRCIGIERAAEIVSAVRARFARIDFVGVFVNEELATISAIADQLRLDAVQLHGDESAEYARALGARFLIKAFRVGPDYSESIAAEYPSDAVLLDGWSPGSRGGRGKSFDWSLAESLRPRITRLILAGGLTADNMEAIRTVCPYAVDVCSGVEEAPGQKNREKLQRFLQAVREVTAAPA